MKRTGWKWYEAMLAVIVGLLISAPILVKESRFAQNDCQAATGTLVASNDGHQIIKTGSDPVKEQPILAAKAVITGPADGKSEPGDLVVLRATGSVASAYKWQVLPPEAANKYFEIVERDSTGKIVGSSVVFASRKSGTYVFMLAVAIGDSVDLAGYVLTNQEVGPPKPPDPPPEPVVNPYKPDPVFQAAVAPVKSFSLSKVDSDSLSRLYGVTARQALAQLSTTTELRAFLIAEGTKLNLKDKYKGLGTEVDSALVKMLGTNVGNLDKVVAGRALDTLAWAVWETGKVGRK